METPRFTELVGMIGNAFSGGKRGGEGGLGLKLTNSPGGVLVENAKRAGRRVLEEEDTMGHRDDVRVMVRYRRHLRTKTGVESGGGGSGEGVSRGGDGGGGDTGGAGKLEFTAGSSVDVQHVSSCL